MAQNSRSIQAADELTIVRKFLRRNNLLALVQLLKESCDRVCEVKLARGGLDVPKDVSTPVPFSNVEWDSVGFFESSEPTRLTIPAGLGGRYLIQTATRWLDHRDFPGEEPPPDSYFYAFVMHNGSGHPAGNDARCTANNVEGGATGTTQHFTYETELVAGDFVELWLWQGFGTPVHCDTHFQMRRLGC